MREILFRGKRKDNGEWIYGVPITDESTNDAYIITSTAGASLKSEINNMYATGFRIIRNTVGQYTGLTDKNGLTKIFEGDIVRIFDGEYCNAVIKYSNEKGSFTVDDTSLYYWVSDIEVIGNIHDNGYPF